MPIGTNLSFDFAINGRPFMLYRDPQGKGRAWARTSIPDAVPSGVSGQDSTSELTDENYGAFPDVLDHVDLWDDWSGGFGDYRRRPGRHNHYNVGLGIDSRLPGRLTIAQEAQPLARSSLYASLALNADYFIDVPLPGVASPPPGSGAVLIVGKGCIGSATPTKFPYIISGGNQSVFNVRLEATGGGTLPFGHKPAVFGSYTYVPNLAGSGFYQRGHDGTTYTVSSLPARWFAVAAGRLWRGHRGNLVQSCAIGADPMVAANWSATLNLGNGQMVSETATNLQDRTYVAFPDGIYLGDQTGTFSNVATTIGVNVNADNVRDVTVHNGMVVFAEAGHVWGYNQSSGQMRQLMPRIEARPFATGSSLAGLLGVQGVRTTGDVRALEAFGRWLYAGVFTGTMSVVYCGYEASGPDLPYVWHPMQWVKGAKVNRLHVDAITTASDGSSIPRRMWMATDASYGSLTNCTSSVYYWPIPLNDEDPFSDPSFISNTYPWGALEMGIVDGGSPNSFKLWRKAEVWQEGLGYDPELAATYGDVSASVTINVGGLLDSTVNTGIGNAVIVGKPKDTAYFTQGASQALGLQAQFLVVLNPAGNALTPDTKTSPGLRAMAIRSTVRPRFNDVITAKVRISDGMSDRQGTPLRDANSMLADLRGFARAGNAFPITDITGTIFPGVVIPPLDEQEIYQGGTDYPDILATVKIGVLDASWPNSPQTPIYPS